MKIFRLVMKILGGILALAVVAGIIYVLTHLNMFMLMFGKGKLSLNDFSKTENALKSSSVYTVTGTSENGGQEEIDCVSKDGAVSIKVTKNGSVETITGTADRSKLPKVDKSDLNTVKKTAETYLNPFLTNDQIVGLGGNLATKVISGNSAGGIDITDTYGATKVVASMDGSGAISFTITDSSAK